MGVLWRVCCVVSIYTWWVTTSVYISETRCLAIGADHRRWTMRIEDGHRGPVTGRQSGRRRKKRPFLSQQRLALVAVRHQRPQGVGSQEIFWQVLRRIHRSHQYVFLSFPLSLSIPLLFVCWVVLHTLWRHWNTHLFFIFFKVFVSCSVFCSK